MNFPWATAARFGMRVPRQLGYKSVKFITHLTVTDDLKKFGKGLGSASPEGGICLVRRHLTDQDCAGRLSIFSPLCRPMIVSSNRSMPRALE